MAISVTRTSMFSGITRTIELDITDEQMHDYNSGTLIQNAFTNLSEDEREFFMTGVTAEEWDEFFGGCDEDETEEEGEV